MKEYLEKLIKDKKVKADNLRKKISASESAEEVRSLGDELKEVETEISSAETQLGKVGANDNTTQTNEENNNATNRSGFSPSQAMNVVATAQMNNRASTETTSETGTMEYRQAFMNYVQRGERSEILKFESRADQSGVAAELGVTVPSTVINRFIEEVEKVYGQLYSRVLKTNIPGGVKFPIGSFGATFKRIAENVSGDKQIGGKVTGYVEFSYNIGEVKISQSILQSVLAVPLFEEKLVQALLKAYVKAMDTEIMTGVAANGQCEGILTEAEKVESRIPSVNIIEFTAAEMADWKTWQTKLFAAIPLSMRSLKPEFTMTSNTYEANIKTLVDDNNRPVYNETFNPIDGAEISRFKGRDVVFVEEDILKNFNDALDGEYFGMYWVPEEAYGINSNMQFTMRKYFDEDTNQWVQKALVINDGKVLNGNYIYLLKKKISG